MSAFKLLVWFYIWTMNRSFLLNALFINRTDLMNETEYNFVLHTMNRYPLSNIITKQNLEYHVGSSFIMTLSKAFNVFQHQFELDIHNDMNLTLMDEDNNNNEYLFYVYSYIQNETVINNNYTETQILIVFVSYTNIEHWYFDKYIYYNFLEQYLSLELDQYLSISITLKNLIWIERDGYIECPDNNNNIDSTSEPTESNTNWEAVTNELFGDIYDFLRWLFIGILGFCCIVVCIGYAHSWIVWNADICIGNAIFFCFAMFDWYSDILFTFTIPVKYIYLWLISFSLLLFPLIGNVGWLVSQQKLWEQDAAIGARVKAWLIRWRPFLFSLTIISGSSFGGINMCNSNMFGYPLFRMGLRAIHLEKFDSKRLFITVLGENVPQLILQGYLYWFVLDYNVGGTFNENKLTLGLAMISGIISILYAFGIVCSAKVTLSRFNDNEEELFEINIISPSDFPTKDSRKNLSYKYKIYPLRKSFASMLAIDLGYVEIHPPVKIEYGYQLRFTLMVKEMGGNKAAFETIKNLIECKEIAEKIQDVWKLSNLPRIEELKWKKNRKRDYQENMVLLQHKPNLKPIQKKKENKQIKNNKNNNNNDDLSISNTQTFSKNRYNQNKALAFHHEIAALKLPSPISDYADNSNQNNNIISYHPNSNGLHSKSLHSNHSNKNKQPGSPWQHIPSYSNHQKSYSNQQKQHDRTATNTMIIHDNSVQHNNNNNNNNNPIQNNGSSEHHRVFSESEQEINDIVNAVGPGHNIHNIHDIVIGDAHHHKQNMAGMSLFNSHDVTEKNIMPHIQYDDDDHVINDNKEEEVSITEPTYIHRIQQSESEQLSIFVQQGSNKPFSPNNSNRNNRNNNNNGNNLEMISNPSKKNTMVSTVNTVISKNTTYAASSKNMGQNVYNFNQNKLIDFDDNDNDDDNDIINDRILLGDNLNDDDIRSQGMSIASTNSEALFQQQLFNHIKNENTFITKV